MGPGAAPVSKEDGGEKGEHGEKGDVDVDVATSPLVDAVVECR